MPSNAQGFVPGKVPRLIGSYLIDEEHSNRYTRLEHMHENEIELLYVYSGEGQYTVNGLSYHIQQGDMVICNQQVIHGEDPIKPRKMKSYCIALTDVYVEGLPKNHLVDSCSIPVINCGALSDQIGEMMRLVSLLHESHEGNIDLICTHTAIAVLYLIHDLLCSRARSLIDDSTRKVGPLAAKMQSYLDNHYREELTLEGLAEILHASEYHLAHVFKAEIGVSPMQYVTRRRMGEAQTLLVDTELPIGDIAEQLGYGNPWNFSTAFKHYVGMPPSQYRRAFQGMVDTDTRPIRFGSP